MDTPCLSKLLFFFRLLFKKPLDKRLSRFLAIMTRAKIKAQYLNTILQKKLPTTNILCPAIQQKATKKAFKILFSHSS